MTSQRLQDKVALITGSSSGLGREIALKYASHGAKLVVVADLQEKPSAGGNDETTVARINRLHGDGRATFVTCNVTDADSVKQAVAEAVKHGGRLDIMVNNAGITGKDRTTFHESNDDMFDKIIAVNVRGYYLGSKWALAQMVKQEQDSSGKRGRVLNIVSIFGLVGAVNGGSDGVAYAASKGAAMNMTRTLALEYRSQGINVNALCPGFLKTALTDHLQDSKATTAYLEGRAGGWGEPKDVADSAVFLVSDEANWIQGIGLPVDGGYIAG